MLRPNPQAGGKPPARPLPARTIAFRFACDATAVSAAWVGGLPDVIPKNKALTPPFRSPFGMRLRINRDIERNT